MKQKSRTIIGFACIALLVLCIVAWFSWFPIMSTINLKQTESFFREQYQPNQNMYVAIHENDWAWCYFAGTKGLPTLRKLSKDESLAPCGQSLAIDLYQHISLGKHIQYYDLLAKHRSGLGKLYIKYILKRDKNYLRKKES